jgi:hypothetical protein
MYLALDRVDDVSKLKEEMVRVLRMEAPKEGMN